MCAISLAAKKLAAKKAAVKKPMAKKAAVKKSTVKKSAVKTAPASPFELKLQEVRQRSKRLSSDISALLARVS